MSADFQGTALMVFLRDQKPLLHSKIIELRNAVESWLSLVPATFLHYTSHTVHHSDEIVLQISKLLFRNDEPTQPVVQFSAMEAYILAAAAYLHDAGMVVSDKEKAELLDSADWKEWTESGGAAPRWREIREFRQGDSPSNEGTRNFLADIQTRYLIAEFVRRTHHLRVIDLLIQHQSEFGGFALGDPILMRTVSDVCAAHGLRQHELEDKDRYPERRDIQGDTVNVRFLAILLRLGDLLDMSHDRACPLLLNAVCPLPPDSLAHWTKYQRLTHSLTSPDRIERTAECETQDEHRFLQDWCKWIEDEVANARILMSRAERHRDWQPPEIGVDPEVGTIKIRPASHAAYIPSDWNFKLDQDEVFQRLIKDVYDHPQSYLRELIQNSLDAIRCQLFLDLKKDGMDVPDFSTQVDEKYRFRYEIRISISHTEVLNELSGQLEQRQVLTVEDSGIGMDRQVIRDYFLQVGRSFYKTEEFRRTFRFVPTSRFGLGFLSVFAVSSLVKVETYKPSSQSGDGPIRLTLTGPRNYLLMEKCGRRSAGTKVEVTLQESLEPGQITKLISHWCPRVEFPIHVSDFGAVNTIIAESPENFAYETPDVTEKGMRLAVRYFNINRPGIEGELYVFALVTGRGESWANWRWANEVYPTLHPMARKPSLPGSLTCFQGVTVGDFDSYPYTYGSGPIASRLDYRTDKYRLPLSREHLFAHGRRSERAMDPEVESRWQELLVAHLAKTDHARGENGWKYKQRLVAYFPFPYFWAHEAEMLPLSIDGRSRLLSLEEILKFPVITTVVHPMSPFYGYQREKPEKSPFIVAWGPSDVGLSDDDLFSVSGEHKKAIFSQRQVEGVRWLSSGHLAIDWKLGDCEPPLVNESGFGTVAFENPDVICFRLHPATSSDQYVVLNTKNELARWVLRVNDACRQHLPMIGIEQVKLLNDHLKWCAWFQSVSEKFSALREFIPRWRDIPGLPPELCPPAVHITPRMFELSKKPFP
jgi:molecular chaperone HtpG